MNKQKLRTNINKTKKLAYETGKALIISGIISALSNPDNYKKVAKYIEKKFTHTIYTKSDNRFMNRKLVYWLNQKFGEKFSKYIYTDDKDALNTVEDIISIPTPFSVVYGVYKYTYNNCLLIVNSKEYTKSTYEDGVYEIDELTVSIIGIKSKVMEIKNEIEELFNTEVKFNQNLMISKIPARKGNQYFNVTTERPINSIFSDQKTKILNLIDIWKSKKEFYYNHHLPFKLCLLLHGKPGTGKTSIVKAIATELKYNIIYINLSTADSYELDNLNITGDNNIILLEEIDLGSLNSTESDNNTNEKNAVINCLLNLLDGINSPENVIFIGTTNHPELIDERLMRAGRFNNGIEIKDVCRKTAEELCIYLEADPQEILTDDMIIYEKDDKEKSNPLYNPAQVQQKILERI